MSVLGRRASRLVKRSNKAVSVVVGNRTGSRGTDGEWIEDATVNTTYQGTFLPADGKTRQEVEAGRRVDDVKILWVFTQDPNVLPPSAQPDTNAATVTVGGQDWIVFKIRDYSHQGHIEAVVYREQ